MLGDGAFEYLSAGSCQGCGSGTALQQQYERWQPRAKYKKHLDPTLEDVKKLAMSCRRAARVRPCLPPVIPGLAVRIMVRTQACLMPCMTASMPLEACTWQCMPGEGFNHLRMLLRLTLVWTFTCPTSNWR